MPTITKISDYKARYQIAKDAYNKKNLQCYIDESEPCLIYELLGAELGKLFIADLDADGIPQTQRFIDIYNSFAIDDSCELHCSIGLKDYLVGLIYYDYVRNDNTYNSQIGNKQAVSENSEIASNFFHDLDQRHNHAIDTGREIQWYVKCYKSEDYPEYRGQRLQISHWL